MRWMMVIGSLFASIVVQAATMDDPLAALKVDMPNPVARWMDRTVACNHWAGEEGYDAARSKEIAHAMKKLRCNQLDKEEKVLLKQYGKQAKVKQRMEAAKQLY